MNKLIRVSALAAGIALSVAVLPTAGAGAAENSSIPEWLFAADAPDMKVYKSGSSTRVSLSAAERVTGFTDRPNRNTEAMTMRQFVRNWKEYGFTADPPNAAVILEQDGKTRTHVVELTSPRISRGQVSFKMEVVENLLAAGKSHGQSIKAGIYDHGALFIDSVGSLPTVSGGNAGSPSDCSSNVSSATTCSLGLNNVITISGAATTDYDIYMCDREGSTANDKISATWADGSSNTPKIALCKDDYASSLAGWSRFWQGTASNTVATTPSSLENKNGSAFVLKIVASGTTP